MIQRSKKVLITGGAGFIGLFLTRLHVNQGEDVTIIDNFFRGKSDLDFKEIAANKKVTMLETDLTTQAGWKKIKGSFDYVYHLAAVNGTDLFYKIPHEVLRINLLTAIYGLERFKD